MDADDKYLTRVAQKERNSWNMYNGLHLCNSFKQEYFQS